METPIEIHPINYIEYVDGTLRVQKIRTQHKSSRMKRRVKRENLSNKPALLKAGLKVGYEVNYADGEKAGCSSKITIADRIFYVKLHAAKAPQYFSGDQQGVIQKEISKAEFELWIGILSDSEKDAAEALKKLDMGKKY